MCNAFFNLKRAIHDIIQTRWELTELRGRQITYNLYCYKGNPLYSVYLFYTRQRCEYSVCYILNQGPESYWPNNRDSDFGQTSKFRTNVRFTHTHTRHTHTPHTHSGTGIIPASAPQGWHSLHLASLWQDQWRLPSPRFCWHVAKSPGPAIC